MAKRNAKFTPKKKATLTPEPKWDRLSKAKTEETRLSAWQECDMYVHVEVTDKEKIHALYRWVELETDWGLKDSVKSTPTAYLGAYSKNAWKSRKLGWTPQAVMKNLEETLKPLLEKGLTRNTTDTYDATAEYFDAMEDDHPWHPTKVKEWVKKWQGDLKAMKGWDESSNANQRMQFQIAQTYLYNLNQFLANGIWLDTHWGEDRENKIIPICRTPAYTKDGLIKRTVGTWYSDVGCVWQTEMEL